MADHAGPQCVVHFPTLTASNSTLMTLSKLQLHNIAARAKQWIELNKQPEQDLANSVINNSQINDAVELEHQNSNSTVLAHQSCYLRFASLSKLETARKAKRKVPTTVADPLPSKKLRSAKATLAGQVLPSVCVICHKAKYQKSKKGSRKIESLSLAETLNAAGLYDAAKVKDDTSLLTLFEEGDAVAREMKYHRSCHKLYVASVHNKFRQSVKKNFSLCQDTWREFIRFIDRNLMENKQCYKLADLHSIYTDMCNESGDTEEHSRQWIQYNLKKHFGTRIIFHRPPAKNESMIVSASDASLVGSSDSLNLSRILSSSDSEDISDIENINISSITNDSELHHAAMILKHDIADKNESSQFKSWPPSASDFTLENCLQSVPPSLFNFLCLMTGVADGDSVNMEKQHWLVEHDAKRKVLAIAQDILYLQSKGSRATPKSLALGMTLRHMTGSKAISQLLGGFGHACSYDTTVRMETALAVKQAKEGADLPSGFVKGAFTTLVYDNIDFAEETLTGHGTTHHTNGIMIQLKHDTAISRAHSTDVIIPKSTRTFTVQTEVIAPYYQTKKCGPKNLVEVIVGDNASEEVWSKSRAEDFAYIMQKYNMADDNLLPGWTAYNINKSDPLPKSLIHYLPVIEASPTQLSTVKHILDSAKNLADKLECESVMVVMDQAVYSKAQQIRWSNQDIEKRIVLRLGEFHTVMCFLGTIGKRFSLSGLEDILIESEVVAAGSMRGVVSGHMYNRSIRAHKLLFEALSRMQIGHFLESLDEVDAARAFQPGDELSSEDYNHILKQYTTYVEERSKSSPTFQYWNSYLEMIYTLLSFVRATRTSNWELHLSSLRFMLPWMFAYDRTHYSRYGPAYWLEMSQLAQTHPWIYQQIQNTPGCWTTQRQSEAGFTSLAADQTIEVTVNRESKTSGGVRGITLTTGAVQRWILSQPAKAEISATCKQLAGVDDEYRVHKEADSSRMKKDEEAIHRIMDTVHSMINPWDCEMDSMVSLSSGAVASTAVCSDLSNANSMGEQKVKQYITERLCNKTEDVFASIKSMKLKTFAQNDRTKSKTPLSNVKTERSMFARLLLVAKNREINMREILSYSLSTVPACLSSSDSLSLSKTNKAALLHVLEDNAILVPEEDMDSILQSALIIDAMAVVQCLSQAQLPATFGQLADLILKNLASLAHKFKATRIDFVGDQYRNVSIKNVERVRRTTHQAQELSIYGPDQKLPKQWKKFLSSGKNKENLQKFIVGHWERVSIDVRLDVYVAVATECKRLQFDNHREPTVTAILELDSNHEEADTRLILHASHASKELDVTIIHSPDTDVAIIATSMIYNVSSRILFSTGTGNKRRLLDLSKLGSIIGTELSSALIGFHAFTGCDTISSFAGKGKKSCYKVLQSNQDFISAFSKIGRDFSIDKDICPIIEKFVCQLYNVSCDSVNEARHDLFCSTAPLEKGLPPNRDALICHMKRSNYQAKIWRLSLTSKSTIPSPAGYGWVESEDGLAIKWMDGPPAPPEVLKLTNCNCKKSGCHNSRCSCLKSGLKCTELCNCVACGNKDGEDMAVTGDDEDSDSDIEI